MRLCDNEISRINTLENNMEPSDYTKLIKNIWCNRDMGDNEDTLMLMFKAKNGMRELYSMGQRDGG